MAITHVRSVGLGVPDLARAREFYASCWALEEVEQDTDRLYLGAGCPDSHVLRLRQADAPQVDVVSLAVATPAQADTYAERVAAHPQSKLISEPGVRQDLGGGYGFQFFDCDGRVVEIAAQVALRPFREVAAGERRPRGISHVVFNTQDLTRTHLFYEQALGFKVSDWVEDFFCFMRAGRTHHLLAFAKSARTSLNHISFEVRGLDEFMRATGSMMRLGHAPLWGPGRHGAGDNTFSYFQDPGTGFVMEYTTALQTIDDEHGWVPKVYTTSPEDTDQWGTSNPFDEVILGEMHRPTDPGLWTACPV
ncbi:VOC family protein [Streptomyces sp. NBC_01320]|uniref:VOC family protein n=1 Tax=Streptomyces sp. NBC_01320 TaxID=2903824 RepID=UPI002E1578F8|nr:VOC family protein [Streptomyces sp. NBC_01320]